nr:hypothetical protein [Deltaproteobacteria bacterium]
LTATVENHLDTSPGLNPELRNVDSLKRFGGLMEKTPAVSLSVVDRQMRPLFFYGKTTIGEKTLNRFIAKAIKAKERRVDYEGKTWGIFWRQKKHLMVSTPLFSGGVLIGGAGALMSLEPLYENARRSQKMVFIYILINTVVLALFGLHQISKAYFEPIKRLAKRAEGYTELEDEPFLVRKGDNEFTQLSQALNNMLSRISQDRKQLQEHIESLKAVNAELKQAQDDIVSAEKYATVGRLASGVAHEIGNPIGIVKGYLELLERGGATEDEQKDFIVRAKGEIDRISSIIRQLLDFSRVSTASSIAVNLHDVIKDVIGLIQDQPMMTDIGLTLSLSAEMDSVFADPEQLRQIFLNLILNAADAILTDPGSTSGEIQIKSENRPDEKHPSSGSDMSWIKVSVIDNGPGIDQDHIDHVFDPFYTTKEPGKGTGLGLWVCYMIANNAGGRMSATSRPGEHTDLSVCLPIHKG